ncbi:DNA-binding transcriptional MerR regulator [Roseinatronobacter thiooxidans]|uniref:DNA-binding transcriptional MerR regulator n=1 Tax=Roseinatronobacter thiooxidans TaxID=121821 RepID=A0A2W7R255_9RHOB|nr:MerR family transcriptional regulator [Roseinatronobacter thiooxidans]PZX48199.1 DNA-binding transcriptional MerR regulator [Roseinatronobacter thiooxidans]
MRKAPDAFRTISEASDALQTPAHVLRFWESKFSQIKPVKRAGGRRYYRPADINLLSGIKMLLHDQGMTIRGVQKLLVEKGARHVAQLAVVEHLPTDAPILEAQKDELLPDIGYADDAEMPSEIAPVTALSEATDTAKVDVAQDDAPEAEAEAEAEAEETAPPTKPLQAEPAATAPILPFPVPPAPKSETGPKNAFANLNNPKRRPAMRMAALAHILRTNPPSEDRLRKAAPAAARLEALLARMQKTD